MLDWEKISVKHIPDETYTKYTKNNKKQKNPIEKLAKDSHRHFTQEDRELETKHTASCSASCITREM